METSIVTKAKKFISSHLSKQFTLEEIAKFCGYSKYHFSREFRKSIGMSVMEFVCKEKIAESRNQLLSGKSIFDIALEYGFDTHTGFTNAFFRYTGCNPSEFRRHEQKQFNYVRGEFFMSNATVVIRPIEMGDVNDIWENVYSRNTPEEIKERIQNNLGGFEDKTNFCVVLEVNKVVVGTLTCGRFNKYSRDSNLGNFVIHPDYQGKGFARQMLEKVKELIKDTSINTLQIQCGEESDDVKNKYISLGFTEVFRSHGLVYLMMAL